MIPVPSDVRVWLAVGRTDMRRGMNGLALQVQEALGRDPFVGDLFVFRGARGDLIKILWHDGLGLVALRQRTGIHTAPLSSSAEDFWRTGILGASCCPIDEPVPSAAMFLRQVCIGNFVQAVVPVVGVAGDEAMFGPSGDCVFVDIETRGRFLFCQHSALSQPVVARAQLVFVDEIGNAQGREAGVVAAASRRLARTISVLVEEFGDLGIDVVVEELVDEFDDAGLRLDLLRRRISGSWW